MIKKIAVYILLCVGTVTFAQQELTSFKVGMKKSNSFVKDALPIIDESNGNISLFLVDTKNVYGYLFNDQFQIIDSLQLENKNRKYKSIIGHSINTDNEYGIYLTNNFEDEFAVVNFSYEKDTSYIKEFEIDLKDETFVQTLNYNHKLYILSITKKTSIINIYTLNNNGVSDKHSIDFADSKFIDRKDKEIPLYELLVPSSSILKGGAIISNSKKIADVVRIKNDILNPVDITAGLSKLYLHNNKVLMTFDENENITQLISIDLTTFQKEALQIKKPFYAIESNKKKTNSFIYDDLIFMMATTKDEFTFTVQNLLTQHKIAEYSATENDSIDFKNAPIIQVGSYYDKYREFEKTQKFLRKVYDGDVGISVYKPNDNYEILLGGKVEYKASGGGMGIGAASIPIASFGAVTVYYNPTHFAYNSYTYTKSTFIRGLFDKDFNHVEGAFPENAYDKIKDFKEEKETTENAKTVFKYKDFYILGNYTPWPYQQYRLRKFED
ncbi:MAG: hypothetical protein R2821_01680 [Flavobacteriaceae bacterium]